MYEKPYVPGHMEIVYIAMATREAKTRQYIPAASFELRCSHTQSRSHLVPLYSWTRMFEDIYRFILKATSKRQRRDCTYVAVSTNMNSW